MVPTYLVLVGLAVAAFIIISRLMIPNLSKFIEQAKDREDIEPIVEAIAKLKPSARPTAYNHAIRRLWDDYHRPLAIDLAKELAKNHSSAKIAQYWLKHVMQVEPKMAREKLPSEFLKQYYHPDVAAQCGPVG